MSAGLSSRMLAMVPNRAPRPPSREDVGYGQGPDAFKVPVTAPFAQYVGANPNTNAKPWVKKFIPPLAMFNDASQWVNILMFNSPLQRNGTPSSDPPIQAQYFTPPPINIENFAAGNLNLQQQLGTIAIQAARLDAKASNYFGG